ncbi:MAG: hypothetical protein ACI93R_003821 [Flavobacteriales bacterium]|jgi:hypothetical protein
MKKKLEAMLSFKDTKKIITRALISERNQSFAEAQ